MPHPIEEERPAAPGRREEAVARLTEELREAGFGGCDPDVGALARRHGLTEEEVRRCLAALEHLVRVDRAPGPVPGFL